MNSAIYLLLFLALLKAHDQPIYSEPASTIHSTSITQDSLNAQVVRIRKNFERINAIMKWSLVKNQDLFESTEGGIAKFYYSGNRLEKILATNYGETFQQVTEYYLLNNQLSFAFEKHMAYNRPIYYDSVAMKDNNDTEAFDVKKTITTEARNYFNAGKLIRRLNSDKNAETPTKATLKVEADRIKDDFKKLISLSKEK